MKAFLKFDASIWFILTVVASASRSVKRSGAKYSLLCGKLYSVLPTPMDIRSGARISNVVSRRSCPLPSQRSGLSANTNVTGLIC